MALLPSRAWAADGIVGYLPSAVVMIIYLVYAGVILTVACLLNMLVLWLLKSLGWRWGWWLGWRWGLLVLPALVLSVLPSVREIWVSWHFRVACEDAGVKVYRQVEVEGFYAGTYGLDESFLEKNGFKFIEKNTNDNRILHIEKRGEQLHREILEHPTARYHLKYVEERIGWELEKLERQAVDSQTGEILGKAVTFRRPFIMPSVLTCSYPDPLPRSREVQPYVREPSLYDVFKPLLN